MKFKVKGGSYSEAGKVYKKGDTFDSDYNLAEAFPFKFELVGDTTPAVPKKKTIKKEKAETPSFDVPLGRDVTVRHVKAADAGLRVFYKDKHYYVTDKASPETPLHPEPLTRTELVAYLRKLK